MAGPRRQRATRGTARGSRRSGSRTRRSPARASAATGTARALAGAVASAYEAGRRAFGSGRVADYIPELANASPGWFGIAVHPVDAAEAIVEGDVDVVFSLQSVSKVFSLAAMLADAGEEAAFAHVGFEPSGDVFHSIVRLEEEHGRPRNPLINAGAIAVSALLPGAGIDARIDGLRAFLRAICPGHDFTIDEDVYRSEAATGFRNLALAHYMRHYGTVTDPELAAHTYFRQCAITVTARGLARLGLFLAGNGRDPLTGRDVLSPQHTRTVLALMTTCGLYDEVGWFAVRVGLPAKSGVSGGLLAIVPGRMSIACFGPALGAKGNSVAGLAALECLSTELGLSLFDPGSRP
jgi:glutaminase